MMTHNSNNFYPPLSKGLISAMSLFKKTCPFNNMAILSLLIIAISFTGCSDEESFQRSTVVPAAEVDLKVDQDKNGNYVIDMEVANLAQPQNLTPPKNGYIVWIESTQGSFNVGKLRVNDKLNASLKSITPYKPDRVKITAEDDPLAIKPSNQVVLTSEKITLKQ